MRAPTVLAAVALAGTVLLGGAGQALADDDEMSNFGSGFGNSSPATPEFGQGMSGFGQDATGSDQEASGFDQGQSVLGLR
ncbi:hypothetical protein IM697_39410 [Streptomyces ferrugineus]|uniref:Uncharacterized protein n=1 Tax=Streptomyces ferrugineus TaxID=1413221 RepID=A0A7M2SI70_9ACTN|nr:hypothetical protein [Streptomyces ferrugineus]QOV36040.1 hypothetical protein IM697_39410 [Streptomyces ferrugineus]